MNNAPELIENEQKPVIDDTIINKEISNNIISIECSDKQIDCVENKNITSNNSSNDTRSKTTKIKKKRNVNKKESNKKSSNTNELVLIMEPQENSSVDYFLKDSNLSASNSNDSNHYNNEKTEEHSTSKKLQIDFICFKCINIYKDKKELENHFRDAHNDSVTYTCTDCYKQFDLYLKFRRHWYRHVHNSKYKCEKCSKGFTQMSLLKVHESTYHLDSYKCKQCDLVLDNLDLLKEHQKSHKEIKINKTEHMCVDCGKILSSANSLLIHRKIHEGNSKFVCEICQKKFVQKINLIHHSHIHQNERIYQCQQCDRRFGEKFQLHRHQKTYHVSARPFKCNICNKMYKTLRSLKGHTMVHSEFRPHICSHCNKGFLSISKLKQHYNIHTGERPYKCKYCARDFTNFPNWLKHTRRLHKVDHRTGKELTDIPNYNSKKTKITPKNKTDVKKKAKTPVETVTTTVVAVKKTMDMNDHNIVNNTPQLMDNNNTSHVVANAVSTSTLLIQEDHNHASDIVIDDFEMAKSVILEMESRSPIVNEILNSKANLNDNLLHDFADQISLFTNIDFLDSNHSTTNDDFLISNQILNTNNISLSNEAMQIFNGQLYCTTELLINSQQNINLNALSSPIQSSHIIPM